MEHASNDPSRDGVLVDGAVTRPSRLTAHDLGRLPQRTVTCTFRGSSGTRTHTYAGPLLLDVLHQAEPRFDPRIKADPVRHVITATGGDQQQATLAWAEIDPDFAGRAVLVALTEDGRPAEGGRPRVVVPGDKCGGRYVAGLVRLHLSAPFPGGGARP
ncbi:molybdopterin-dependent oxidoreductase [Micromonospora zamorensis]|uniref:Molybdopterin-dependent oxidoreductase n=1 Tax=Micromonospora zamorensis TaxID=709883 RepID=A0ABZ1PKR0_9ACTN